MRSPLLALTMVVLAGAIAQTASAQTQADSVQRLPVPRDATIPVAPLLRLMWATTGLSIGVIDSTEIAASVAPTFSELLQARLPGLTVFRQGGTASDGSLLMVRGPASFNGPGEPIVIIDGIRVDSRQADSLLSNGSVMPSRLDDIPPDDIARIEVLTGPAAALYGSGAAAGVILVTTKSGGAAPLRFSGRAESLTDFARDDFPANYRRLGISPTTGQAVSDCSLRSVAAGSCTPTGLDVWNPLEQASPYRIATSGIERLTLAGSTLGTSVYLSGYANQRTGVIPRDELSRTGARVKLSRDLRFGFRVQGTAAYLHEQATRGADGPFTNASAVTAGGLLGSAENDANRGYAALPGSSLDSLNPSQRLIHSTLGAGVEWRPLAWLVASGTLGRDNVTGRSFESFPPLLGQGPNVTENSGETLRLTTAAARVAANYKYGAMGAVSSLGIERWSGTTAARDSFGNPPLSSVSATRFEQRSTALTFVQGADVADRLALVLSLQRLSDPLLGSGWYPGANASWRPVPKLGWLMDPRVRAAYSEAAGSLTSLADLLSVGFTQPFQPTVARLHTERSKNFELGVDAAIGHKASVSLTLFDSRSPNLVGFTFGPSAGGGAIPVQSNAMENKGIEGQLECSLYSSSRVQWDAVLTVAVLQNRVTKMDVPPRITPFGAVQLGSPFAVPRAVTYTYADANHDGIIGANEVQLGPTDDAGSPLPTFASSLNTSLHLPDGWRFTALLDYRHGMTVIDQTAEYRCGGERNCRAAQDPTAPLADQAAAIAANAAGGAGVVGFVEDASFLKLRELALHWRLPISWSRLLGSGAELAVAGRNLATATNYRGADPEVASGLPSELPRRDFARTPIPRELVVRLDLGPAR